MPYPVGIKYLRLKRSGFGILNVPDGCLQFIDCLSNLKEM